jgi:glycosyltransferase involved in cell wall biosynthesis
MLRERFMNVDYVTDELTMAELYGSADLFVISSMQDNLPNTALEAQACGIPTVASSVGGLKEIVSDGKTGTLVPPGNVVAMRDALVSLLLDDRKRGEMATESRSRSVTEFALETQATRYLALYQSLT